MKRMRRGLEKQVMQLACPPGRASAGRRRQRDVLCDVMLSACRRNTWLTLEELAKLTHYPPASISAQLRHLRKREFGGYEVDKRQRVSGKLLRGEDFGTVWEYRLERGVPRISRRKPRVQRELCAALPMSL
jgi:hypothetical protein